MTPAMTPFPNKVTVTGPWGYNLDYLYLSGRPPFSPLHPVFVPGGSQLNIILPTGL